MARQLLTLYPDTFIRIRPDKGLLYNTRKYTIKEFEISPEVEALCTRLLEYDRRHRVPVDPERLSDRLRRFVDLVVSRSFGYLAPVRECRRAEASARVPRNDLLRYFSELTVQLGGECPPNDWYRQTFYPYPSEVRLRAMDIIDFLNRNPAPHLKRVHLILPDLYARNNLSLLVSWLLAARERITFYLPYGLVRSSFVYDTLINLGFSAKILCRGCEDSAVPIREHIRLGHRYGRTGTPDYHFLVRSHAEYDRCSRLLADSFPSAGKVIPIYSRNLKFIQEKIYRNRALYPGKLSRKEMRLRERINPNFFGALTLMPDRQVYSNVNCPPLGDMREPVREIIARELELNHAWRRVRDMPPCSGCPYRWSCPPLSNYDFVIGKKLQCYRDIFTAGSCTCG